VAERKEVSGVQSMRGFEFLVCHVQDKEGNIQGKTKVILLGVKSVFGEIRRVGVEMAAEG